METPGQPCVPATCAVTAVLDAAALVRAGHEQEAIACVLMADPVPLAIAAVRLLAAALAGLDRLNGTVTA
jgi:hypothetical protein